jgi:hypothetical protein
LRVRLALASAAGVAIGLGIAMLLTRLAVASVRAAGTVADPSPPVVTVLPWAELAAWCAAMLVVLTLAGWLATRTMIASRRASRSSREPATEDGVLSEGAAG